MRGARATITALASAITYMYLALPACAQNTSIQQAPTQSVPTPVPESQPGAGPAASSPADAAPKPFIQRGPWSVTGAYTLDLLDDVDGGLRRGVGHLQKLALSAAFDGAQDGHDGWAALISAQYLDGGPFSARYSGDIQSVSNIDALNGLRLYEAWVSRELPEERGVVKTGLIDLNSEFDTQETAALFLNSAHGIGSEFSHTGYDGPSIYPLPALGSTVLYRPAEGWALRAGIFDGVAGDYPHLRRFGVVLSEDKGALGIIQAERRFGDRWRVEVGAWGYTARFDDLGQRLPSPTARRTAGDIGVYGLVEGKIMPAGDGDEGGLSGWVRAGMADPTVNAISNYEGAGLVYVGLWAERPKDESGFAVARAGFGAPAEEGANLIGTKLSAAETTFELTYRFAFRDWLTIQPDLQYVLHPDGSSVVSHATVAGVRLAFTLTR